MGMNGTEDAVRIGDGKTELSLGVEKGRIVMAFPKPVEWVAFDPANAVDIAKAMIDSAEACGCTVTLQVPRKVVPPIIVEKLVKRVEIVMDNLQRRKKLPKTIATELVHIVLREVI